MSNDGEEWFRGPLIGKGSFGSVFLATLKKPKSRFSCFPSVMAVKSAEVSDSGSLQKEKEVLNNIQGSPFVLRCFGEEITTQENSQMVYNLLLEYASGGTLADLISKSNGCGLPESDVKRYTRSILKGLNHIHGCGYVHCDLKPENILLFPKSDGFVAKIGDFGLAKRSAQSLPQKKRRLDPYFRGTAFYMAPESVNECVQEPPSDIWALGCVVLEMLTGNPPWDHKPGLNTEELQRLIGDGCELPEIPTEISKEGREFLKGCFVKKPMFRFTDEMLLDLPFVAGEDDNEFDEEGLSSSSVEIYDELDYSFTSSISEYLSFGSCSEETETQNVESSAKEVTKGGQKRKRSPSSTNFCDGDHIFSKVTQPPPIPLKLWVLECSFGTLLKFKLLTKK